MIDQSEKNKPRNRRVEPPFLDEFKLFLSSMSARTCAYLYLNCVDGRNDIIILSNADTELLYIKNYNVSLHILEFKDKEYLDKIYESLKIPRDKPYVIHLRKALSVINRSLKEKTDLVVYTDEENQIFFTTSDDKRTREQLIEDLRQEAHVKLMKAREEDKDTYTDDPDENFDDDDMDHLDVTLPLLEYTYAFGSYYDDYRTLVTLTEEATNSLKTRDNLPNFYHKRLGRDDLEDFRINVFRSLVPTKDLINSKGETHPELQDGVTYAYVLYDGLDIPSYKEFTRKLDNTWDGATYAFLNEDEKLNVITILESPLCITCTYRPFAGIVPLYKASKVKSLQIGDKHV